MASLNGGETSQSTAADASRRGAPAQISPSEFSRPANLQRIAQRKAQVKTYPRRKKLEKLGVYSHCKVRIMRDHFNDLIEKSDYLPHNS